MKQEMEEILKNYHEAEDDKSCPVPTHPKYPNVGEVWEPWCD